MKKSNLIILLMTVLLIASGIAFGNNTNNTIEQPEVRIESIYETLEDMEPNKLLLFADIHKLSDEYYVKTEE